MNFHFYGHSTFHLEAEGTTLLFDPFISGNPKLENQSIESISANYILISHGHADHILDTVAIAKKTGATVICAWEIHEWLNKQGIENTHPMNSGGSKDFGEFKVKCVVAQHSSGLPDGSYGGNPMGFIIWFKDKVFYYSGDTALTLDMQLIPSWAKIDYCILPIGDNFTMGAKDAARAAKMVECPTCIGVHFDTFGFIEIDHEKTRAIFSEQNIKLILPKAGEDIPF